MKGRAMRAIVTMENQEFESLIRQAVEATLQAEGMERDCEVEVSFASLSEIRRINREQRGVDRPTDVLSFPMEESPEDAPPDPSTGAVFLGSMVLCPEKARAQALEYGHSLEREIGFLTVHSVLHLLGYDHETGEEEEAEMFQKQEAVLRKMGLTR
ncbi:MAG: rRNA maturation RNase YbeY [Clostridiales bacterium]|nr:MAG: rRNA maturation RNase YbeY [Clostridiales bacterium]